MFDRDKSDDKHFRGLNILMSNSIIRTFDPRASNFLRFSCIFRLHVGYM